MENIDFVISWVNSNDNEWQRKKSRYSDKVNKLPNADNEERYRDYGTLKYLLRSIELYAPWVHKIYLITDNQRPDWLQESHTKLKVIDHTDIIPTSCLPTFNSSVIELCMDKIPGLTEHFVYFNDDFLINAPVKETDFFKDGLPCDFRIYSQLKPYSEFDRILFNNVLAINKWLKKRRVTKKGILNGKYGVRGVVKNLSQLVLGKGLVSNYVLYHNAYAFNKSSFVLAKKIWKKEIEYTLSQKLRSLRDVSVYLIRYYQLETGNFCPRSINFAAYYTLNEYKAVASDLADQNHHLICINDADTVDYLKKKSELVKILNVKFLKKSSFER